MLINLLACDVCGSVVSSDTLMQDGTDCARRFDTGKDVTTCSGTLRTLGAVVVYRPVQDKRDSCGCGMVEVRLGEWQTMHVIGVCRNHPNLDTRFHAKEP